MAKCVYGPTVWVDADDRVEGDVEVYWKEYGKCRCAFNVGNAVGEGVRLKFKKRPSLYK